MLKTFDYDQKCFTRNIDLSKYLTPQISPKAESTRSHHVIKLKRVIPRVKILFINCTVTRL